MTKPSSSTNQSSATNQSSTVKGSAATDPVFQSERLAQGKPSRHSLTSGVWIGLISAAIFLIVLVVFIAQNSRRASIHFFGWHGNFPIALIILVSAVIGILVIAIPGSVRILQLRRELRKSGGRSR